MHEIKHDGYRLMARRDPVGIRLITRRGNDWTQRYPLVVEAVNHLNVRSCLIDGEVVCCDERGLSRFDVLRRRRNEAMAFLYALIVHSLDRRVTAFIKWPPKGTHWKTTVRPASRGRVRAIRATLSRKGSRCR